KLASRLEHANIFRIEQLGRDGGTLYIAMEYVEGLDLRELLRRASRQGVPLPVELSLRIVIEILKGLDYAHRAKVNDEEGRERIGVIHRDVSPSNVLLSFEGEVKVCDFGIARAHDEGAGAHAWSEAMIEGKAGYMSPEQARGEPLDPRADVFAAGIILWELVSGKKLYKARAGENLLEVAKRAVVPELPRRGMHLEEELFVIVRRALARDRTSRYASAGAMLRDLESFSARSGLTASTLKLRRFLSENFEGDLAAARSRRELATKALARGPLAVVDVVAPPVVLDLAAENGNAADPSDSDRGRASNEDSDPPSRVVVKKKRGKSKGRAVAPGQALAPASARLAASEAPPMERSGKLLVWIALACVVALVVVALRARG
ncbi:MAG TPA: serine/threonine-protein kinase, partial [Polyangiaceae bacterium]|nr:serine/threonine-protein kinase [Polyangiaceae bacterium]